MVLYKALNLFFNIIETLIFIRVVLSWLNLGYDSTIVRFVHDMTEPILYPAKKLLSELGLDRGMLDFSPLVALLFLNIVKDIILRIFY